MIKKRTILLLLMLIFFCDCQSQNIGISYNERGADSTLYFEIENYMYLSSYEYYFSHFCFPSTIDTLFYFMLESLSLHSKQHPFPDNIKKLLTSNKGSFNVQANRNKLMVFYNDTLFFSTDKPFMCGEFCETGPYAGFTRNGVACHDRRAYKIEKLFNHFVWKRYARFVDNSCCQHIVDEDNLTLGYIGLTYNSQQDSLFIHNICSYKMELYKPYYSSLQKLSRRFCRKYNYDGLCYSAPFVFENQFQEL